MQSHEARCILIGTSCDFNKRLGFTAKTVEYAVFKDKVNEGDISGPIGEEKMAIQAEFVLLNEKEPGVFLRTRESRLCR